MTTTVASLLPGLGQGSPMVKGTSGRTDPATHSSNIRHRAPIVTGNSALEQLPHVASQVCFLWGQREFEVYVNRLIMDSRNGKRQGLPWEAAQDLLFLVELSIAKRALVASQVTGKSFKDMYSECLHAAGQSTTDAADPWGEPCSSRESRQVERDRPRPKTAPVAEPTVKKGFWSRLFG